MSIFFSFFITDLVGADIRCGYRHSNTRCKLYM